MAITVTENAAKQIKNQLAKRGSGMALRIGVKPSGCSGYSYTYDFADEVRENDQLIEAHDAKVVLDNVSLQYIDGSNLDFVTEGLKQVFKIDNPKVTAMCGCGESFSIKV
ncbi:MAG: HesB/IscA family protein [Gallionellaceae bacterium]|jgi:iron-sulfur cluster assembly protein